MSRDLLIFGVCLLPILFISEIALVLILGLSFLVIRASCFLASTAFDGCRFLFDRVSQAVRNSSSVIPTQHTLRRGVNFVKQMCLDALGFLFAVNLSSIFSRRGVSGESRRVRPQGPRGVRLAVPVHGPDVRRAVPVHGPGVRRAVPVHRRFG